MHYHYLEEVWPSVCPPYIALSYAWGPTLSHGGHLVGRIVCDNAAIRVTEHLNSALRRIRNLLDSGWPNEAIGMRPFVWIDALCIDQETPSERAQQVQLMGKIYGNSSRLLIWLGETLPGDVDPAAVGAVIDACTSERVCDLWSAFGVQTNELMRRGLISIYLASWFTRRWILQEIWSSAPAHRFMLFRSHIWSTQRFADFAESFSDMDPPVLAPQIITSGFLERAQSGPQHPREYLQRATRSLLARLWTFLDAQCSLPHDRFFALLSICDDVQDIHVDYLLPYSVLATRMAERFVKQGYVIRVLMCALLMKGVKGDSEGRDDLPSWVPDWHASKSLVSNDHRALAAQVFAQYDSEYLQLTTDDISTKPVRTGQRTPGSMKGSTLKLPMWLLDPNLSPLLSNRPTCSTCGMLHAAGLPHRWLGKIAPHQLEQYSQWLELAQAKSCVLGLMSRCQVGWLLHHVSGTAARRSPRHVHGSRAATKRVSPTAMQATYRLVDCVDLEGVYLHSPRFDDSPRDDGPPDANLRDDQLEFVTIV